MHVLVFLYLPLFSAIEHVVHMERRSRNMLIIIIIIIIIITYLEKSVSGSSLFMACSRR